MCEHEDEEVLKLSLEQGKIIKRLHARLDHRALSTATLKEELRYEYKLVEDYTKTSVECPVSSAALCSGASDDDEGRKQDVKDSLTKANRISKQFRNQQDEIDVRLKRFKDNQYPIIFCLVITKTSDDVHDLLMPFPYRSRDGGSLGNHQPVTFHDLF